jgi:EAL domain-containing protein (putative c-di-GMP-specific phosphodiesterase class I)
VHQRRFGLLHDFRRALDEPGSLRLVFQPRVDLATGRCCGAEALLRWSHPLLGEVSPGEFIPIIEQTSLARPVTAWVLSEAMKQLNAWRAAGLDISMSVNVSAANLEESDFAQTVQAASPQTSDPPEMIELEVTETAVMENAGHALLQLAALEAAGVRLAIDDFGTGYSSLAYLQLLPAQVVKIDQSFILGLEEKSRSRPWCAP